tara:strand:- start:351 stop:1175 length:825 start_codon:yes stop_codon:yes gene_type:complete
MSQGSKSLISGISYDTFKDIPYLNTGNDISYVNDLDLFKTHITSDTYYLDISEIRDKLDTYYEGDGTTSYSNMDLDNLNDYILNALVENENLSKNELKNKLNHAIKTENLYKNVKNNEFYNPALKTMAIEDISLDSQTIENIQQSLHNKERNLEIRTYYEDKMKQQIIIVKIVIVICLIMLALSFFYKINVLSTNIYLVLIGIGLASIVIFTVGKLVDILMRDNYKYDEYAFIRSHHYLNKGDKQQLEKEIPLHEQKDLISNKCLKVYNDSQKS